MNKKLVDKLLPAAVDALKKCEIAKLDKKDGIYKIDKNFRGQISSFGAAVSYGSLLAAAAFFNEQGGAKNDRAKLMKAINTMLKDNETFPGYQFSGDKKDDTLFKTIQLNQGDERKIKNDVLACAVALKLGMNLYALTDGDSGEAGGR